MVSNQTRVHGEWNGDDVMVTQARVHVAELADQVVVRLRERLFELGLVVPVFIRKLSQIWSVYVFVARTAQLDRHCAAHAFGAIVLG